MRLYIHTHTNILEKEKQRNNGITLIALVVTIVVLLILAGVSINIVIGNNGIITKAQDAKEKTEQAKVNEQTGMDDLDGEIEGLVNGNNGGGNAGGNSSLTPGNGTTPYFPSDDFIQVAGTNLDNGLVIEDSQGNQYVWIEVPKTATVYPTAGLAITEFTDDEYTKIENDLHTYTSTYRNGTNYTDTYYADSTTGWFADDVAYNTAKNKMLKSVYQNGGFWLGRYEAGIENNRTASGPATTTPVSKANMYPYTNVTRTQAKVLAEQVQYGSYTGSLMFGVQWDLVLKYLETKGATQAELSSDSSNWGNYADSNFSITNENAKYAVYNNSTYVLGEWNTVLNNYTKQNLVLLTTGANETRNSKQNICDLVGNVCEWTLEKCYDTDFPCVYGGNSYLHAGSENPASIRNANTTSYSSHFYRLQNYTLLNYSYEP